jgi:hypothetical protein
MKRALGFLVATLIIVVPLAAQAECRVGGDGHAACGYNCVVDGFGKAVCARWPDAQCRVGGDGHARCGYNCLVDGHGRTVCGSCPSETCTVDGFGNGVCG